jgi:hypothetical protein
VDLSQIGGHLSPVDAPSTDVNVALAIVATPSSDADAPLSNADVASTAADASLSDVNTPSTPVGTDRLNVSVYRRQHHPAKAGAGYCSGCFILKFFANSPA